MASRLTTYILLTLLLVFQGQLWFGRGSVFYVNELTQKLAMQATKNAQAKMIGEQLQSDVHDLKENFALIEDRARLDLGMIKPNEIFVQYAK